MKFKISSTIIPLVSCLLFIGFSCSQPVQTTQATEEITDLTPTTEPAPPAEFFYADKQSLHHHPDGTLKVAVTDTISQAIIENKRKDGSLGKSLTKKHPP